MPMSVGGMVSGLDTASLITQLVEIKRRPISLMEGDKSTKEKQLNAFQSINSKLSNLLSTVDEMDTTEDFMAKTAAFANDNSSDNNKVVSIATTSTVTAGSFDITVTQLAEADKYIHTGVSDKNAAISTVSGEFSFTYNAITTNISVSANSTTLNGLKDSINRSDAGVTATIINTGDASVPYRLVITADSTGAANTISVDSSSTFGSSFENKQVAKDATITIDGITINKDSNETSDIIEGATLKFESVGAGKITFSNDTTAVKEKINDFIKSYNELSTYINTQLAYNVSSKTTGTLFANSTLISIQNTLKGMITIAMPGLSGDYTRLSQIGINTNETTGTLAITDSELSDALRDDFEGVAKLFTSFGETNDGRVTFIGFTDKTETGTYELYGIGGFAAQGFTGASIKKEGETSGRSLGDASSKFFTGAEGNPEEGMSIRIDGNNPGSYGTIKFSLGIAAQFKIELDELTDKTIDGPLTTEINALTGTIDELNDQIDDASHRLTLIESNIRNKFINLEIQMNKLQAQGNFLTSALAGLSINS